MKFNVAILDLFFTISSIFSLGTKSDRLSSFNTQRNQSLYSKTYAKYPGDLYMAGLFSMNRFDETHSCREIIEQDGLQVLAAAIYGIQLVNNMSLLPISLGILAVDTCQNVNYVVEQSVEFMQFKITDIQKSYTCQNGEMPKLKEELESFRNIFGVFGAGNSDVTMAVSNYLKLIKLPQLSYFSTNPSLTSTTDNNGFFRTIPSDDSMTKAIIGLLKKYKWQYVLLLKDSSDYSEEVSSRFEKQIQDDGESEICLGDKINIKTGKSFASTVDQIVKSYDKKVPRVILTFLNQPIAEAFVDYIGKNPNEKLSQLMWIGTDSWGGRNWIQMTASNSILNNTIAVIPRAFNNSDFMEYYKSRIPSKIDCDPWLARLFEIRCGCHYKNRSLFIVLELDKMRTVNYSLPSCEDVEMSCKNTTYQDLRQMLYIHYVIDGVLAYGYTLQKLIPKNCSEISREECVKLLFSNGALNLENITRVMKNINFTDSTEETFRFLNNSGVPKYSIVYFNKTLNEWTISGNIESKAENMNISTEKRFDEYVRDNFQFPLCDTVCSNREARTTLINCCWTCTKCKPNEIVLNEIVSDINSSNIQTDNPKSRQMCTQCEPGQEPNTSNNSCVEKQANYISFSDGVSISLIIINIIGLISGIISSVVMVLYWRTPIIKAFGRETSSIILIGTMLSFCLSIAILHKPTNALCVLRWCSPPFCSTLVYAAILTKTNRIARIFGIKLSSKKNATPRFISPISQINIVLIITAVECVIMVAVVLTSTLKADYSENKNVWDCSDNQFSSLISIWLIPTFLLFSSTVYAFKIRKTPDGFNETRNLNFLNLINCIIFATCFLLQQVLTKDKYSVLPFSLMLTLGAHGNLIILFIPKIYLILFRPSKNTIQFITSKSRSFSLSPSINSSLEIHSTKLKDIRCERCHFPMMSSAELDQLAHDFVGNNNVWTDKARPKVQFSITPNDDEQKETNVDDSFENVIKGFENKSYVED